MTGAVPLLYITVFAVLHRLLMVCAAGRPSQLPARALGDLSAVRPNRMAPDARH